MAGDGKTTVDKDSRLGIESKSNRMDKIFEAVEGLTPKASVELLVSALAVVILVGKDPDVTADSAAVAVAESLKAEVSRRESRLADMQAH